MKYLKNMLKKYYDVVVVGASFAGLSFAYHSDPSLSILMIDRKEKFDAMVESTGLITQGTKDLLEEFVDDLDDFIPNAIDRIGITNPNYQDYFFSKVDDPWIYSTDTPNLVKHMVEHVPPHVQVVSSTSFLDVIAHENTVKVVVQKGGEKKEIQTRFLIGADGARSLVAKKTNLSQNKKFLIGLEKVYQGNMMLGDRPDSAIYHHWFGEYSLGYGGWSSPTIINNKPAIRIGLAKLSDGIRDLHKIDDFVSILEKEKIIKRNAKKEIGMFVGTIPIDGPLHKVSNNYACLLGDAAGLCGAFAADGIKGAIVSGKIIAELLPQYLAGDKKALTHYFPLIQKRYGLIKYYYKQLFYRFCWDRIKSDRSFHLLYQLIKKDKQRFLYQFCDSKDYNSSLLAIILKRKNIPALSKLFFSVLGDMVGL